MQSRSQHNTLYCVVFYLTDTFHYTHTHTYIQRAHTFMDCIWWTKSIHIFAVVVVVGNIVRISLQFKIVQTAYISGKRHRIHLMLQFRCYGASFRFVVQFFAISFLLRRMSVVSHLVSNHILFRTFKKMRMYLIFPAMHRLTWLGFNDETNDEDDHGGAHLAF